MNWIISTNRVMPSQLPAAGSRFFYHFDAGPVHTDEDLLIAVDGFVIPRLGCSDQLENYHGPELVQALFRKYGRQFINRVKGIFTIIIIEKGDLSIYNDTHDLRKFFIWTSGRDFIISNRIKLVAEYCDAGPDFENMAIYCLTEHFVGEMTGYRNVRKSRPASHITYGASLDEKQYWKPDELFAAPLIKSDIDFYVSRWSDLIKEYITRLGGREVSLTLTGGSDSRLVLAGLHKSGAQINTFSYGDPGSHDVLTANKISARLSLNYSNHHISTPTAGWMAATWERIAEHGDTLLNLHRAHRYQAAQDEKIKNPGSEILFTGLMGGEYIRGIEYDGYIIADYFRSPVALKTRQGAITIRDILTRKGLNIAAIDFSRLSEKLESLSEEFMHPGREREFLLAFYIYGCAHHYQDSHIYMNQFKSVVNPFMDIDFLNMLAGSKFISFRHPGNLFNALWSSRFQVGLTHRLLPELSDIPYNKKGLYTANDMHGSRLSFISKRLKGLTSQIKYHPNFKYGDWMKEFVRNQIESLDPAITSLFLTDQIKGQLGKISKVLTEKEWHYFTNPVNLSKIFKS